MIAILSTVRVFLATEPQDFRKCIDGLAAVVQSHLQHDALTGDVFVFHNRRRTALKVLYWDHGGFCLVYKRLERGRVRLPRPATALMASRRDPERGGIHRPVRGHRPVPCPMPAAMESTPRSG